MNTIQSFPYRHLTNANQLYARLIEHYGIISDVAQEETDVATATKLIIEPKVNDFIEKNDRFSQSIRQMVASPHTRNMQEIEPERDRITHLCERIIRNAMRSLHQEVVHAANVIDVTWRLYGNISNRQQDEQTRITEKLLRDLSTEKMKTFVHGIPMFKEALNELQAINDLFAEEFNQRTVQREDIITGLTASLRRTADIAAAEVAVNINVVVLLHTHPKLTEMIIAINNLLDQARLDLSARRRGRNLRNQHTNPDENIDGEEGQEGQEGQEEEYPDKEA